MIARWRQSKSLPIGIDLGASGAKTVQLRVSRGQYSVIAAARIAPPNPGFEAEDVSLLAKAAAAKIEALHCVGSRCVVSLDNRLLRVRSIRMPKMSDEEIGRSLELEGAERLGLKPEDAQVGWLRAGEVRQGDETRDELILAGAPRTAIEKITDAFLDAGLTPIAVEPAFAACARALGRHYRRQSDQKHVRIVVDVGAKMSDIMVLRGDCVAFCKQLDWGGVRLDETASQKLRLEPEAVAEIRRQRRAALLGADAASAAPVDARAERAIFDAIRPLLGELAHEVTLCMRYWMVTFRGERPEAVVLAGGEAEEPQLASVIQEATGIPTKVGRPLEGMAMAGASFAGADRRGAMSQWTVAAGLSLRGEQMQARRPQRAATREAA